MNKLLFMGDSLTAGHLGSSYLKVLRGYPALKDCTAVNGGEDGYTIEGIRIKMESLLETGTLPDVLILGGGANDILLPFMQEAGKEWGPFIRKLNRHGSIPLETESLFRKGMNALLSSAFDRGVQKVLTCTIPCLGENLSSPLNRKRESYNRIIREVTREFQSAPWRCALVDPAEEFERRLKPYQPGSDYLFKTPVELQTDSRRIIDEGEERICSERNLYLTIDGAHLNRAGADAVAEVLLKSLKASLL